MGLVRAGRYSGSEAVHGRALLVQMLTRLETCSKATLKALYAELAPGARPARSSFAANVLAELADINPATVKRWGNIMPGARKRLPGATAGAADERPLPAADDDEETPLPAVDDSKALPSSEATVVEAPGPRADDAPPAPTTKQAEIVRRTEHPHYKIGMNLASLATLWAVEGWPKHKFQAFVAWAATRFPFEFGTMNNSARWISEFSLSLRSALHTAICSEIHAIVPATGMPSFLSRVIDVVSTKAGASLMPTIHVYTSVKDGLQWCLVGCPSLENAKPGLGPHWFRFHGGDVMVRSVHNCEGAARVNKDDRLYRIVLTVGDQAIQGPGSTKFSEKEAAADGIPCNISPRRWPHSTSSRKKSRLG